MPQSIQKAKKILERILQEDSAESIQKRLKPRLPGEEPLPKRIPAGVDSSCEGLEKRQQLLKCLGFTNIKLTCAAIPESPEQLKGNIENHIGYASIPVGVIGPLRINGLNAYGDFFVPMATTEGALVASYHRGAHVISQSGGASVMCLSESISRAPCFVFNSLVDTGLFLAWVLTQVELFQEIVSGTTRHGTLIDMQTTVNGKVVYLTFEYTTGDAAGQNMVTIATEAICQELVNRSPIKPVKWFLEGNFSGDKKVTMLAFLMARGKKVIAETTIPATIVRKFLHTEPADMVLHSRISTQGAIMSGSIGVQGHFANALAAIFIACGQDAACAAEAAMGLTQMEVTSAGDLCVTVTLPNLPVGTVGGGTHLPTAQECLAMVGCQGAGTSRKFAEICAATVLAGEISIVGALSAGDFGKAHATFRHKQ